MLFRQVFWLTDQTINCVFPTICQWHCAIFVPDYSDGLALDFNEVPFYVLQTPE